MSTNPTPDQRLAAIAPLMARMAARDPGALAEFLAAYGTSLRTVMRSHLASFGDRRHRDLDDLVRDAALVLWDIAPAWRPDGGAMPWKWAGARLRRLAASHLGQHADRFEDDRGHMAAPSQPAATPTVDGATTVARLAEHHPELRLLVAALAVVASERDARIWLDCIAEKAAGNRSPALTVAAIHDLTPAAVRKVVQRVRHRLEVLAAGDPAYSPLAVLPVVAAGAA